MRRGGRGDGWRIFRRGGYAVSIEMSTTAAVLDCTDVTIQRYPVSIQSRPAIIVCQLSIRFTSSAEAFLLDANSSFLATTAASPIVLFGRVDSPY